MAQLTKRETSEAKTYFLRRIAQDDLSETDLRALVGYLRLSKSSFWLNAYVTELLSEFAAGERNAPSMAMLLLAESIAAIESVAPGSKIYCKPIAVRQADKTSEQSAVETGSTGDEVLQ